MAQGAVLTRLRAAEVKRARLLHVLRDEELAMARLKKVSRMEGSQEMQSKGEAARAAAEAERQVTGNTEQEELEIAKSTPSFQLLPDAEPILQA